MIAYRRNVNPASDAVFLAQEQIAFWLSQDINSVTAWLALTGAYQQYVSWSEVRGYMIGWLLKQDALPLAA